MQGRGNCKYLIKECEHRMFCCFSILFIMLCLGILSVVLVRFITFMKSKTEVKEEPNYPVVIFPVVSIPIILYSLLLDMGVIHYLNGLVPHVFPAIRVFPVVVIPLLLLILTVMAIPMIFRKKGGLLPAGMVGATICIVVGSYYFQRVSDWPQEMYKKGIAKRMEPFDAAAVREWMQEDPIFRKPGQTIDENKWPNTIKSIQPDSVFYGEDKTLLITWTPMREIQELFVVCPDGQKPEWIPSRAQKMFNGFFWRR